MKILCLAAVWSALLAGTVSAQIFEDPRINFDLSPDPLARSPRLLGMGRLSLVMEDPHNRINLWDFAGNPTGLFGEDSASTFEIRPGRGVSSSVRDVPGYGFLRQYEADGGFHVGYEGWRRVEKTAYGAIGDVVLDRTDRTYGDFVELRSKADRPSAMPVVTGITPRTKSGRSHYAVRLITSTQNINDDYRLVRFNSTGSYIDQNGEQLQPPNPFTPTDTRVGTLGAGVATSYRFGPGLTAALGLDAVSEKLRGENSSPLYEATVRENRPYAIGQATLIGRLGSSIEWGADGHGWKSSSQQNWGFTVSQGAGAPPLSGRGKLIDRKEEGTTMRTRARWHSGSLQVGAGFNTGYRKTTQTPPDSTDLTSLNYFLNKTYSQVQSGTSFPDSAVADQSREWLWEAGGGVAWRLTSSGAVAGVEYHRSRKLEYRDSAGEGPRRVAWDVRGGLEYPCTPALTGRIGYIYSWEDRDEFTRENEYQGYTLCLGAGVHPTGSSWRFESGYAIRWERADFGDPGAPRSARQQLAAQAHWAF